MKLKKRKYNKRKTANSYCTNESAGDEIISLDECKTYFVKYELSDQRITDIRNSVIGLVDGIINSYLDRF